MENYMEEKEMISMIDFFSGEEVKIVWNEEPQQKPKVGHGKIVQYDGTFVYLIGKKGKLALNCKDVTAVKQSE
jgi:hypothetical protein